MADTFGVNLDPDPGTIRVGGEEYEGEDGLFVVPPRAGRFLVGRHPVQAEGKFLELAASGSLSPADGATGVAVGASIVIAFKENVKAGEALAAGCLVVANREVVATGTPTTATTKLTIKPSANMAAGTLHRVIVREGAVVSTAEGIATDGDITFSFTTA